MKNYILNALNYEYSNGIVKGTNNLINQIKKEPKYIKTRNSKIN